MKTTTKPIEPYYLTVAKRMLDTDIVPLALENKLAAAEALVQKVKPCGHLSSTQVIATLILQWEMEKMFDKFEIKHLDANY